jgi:predicted Zn-dependent protease
MMLPSRKWLALAGLLAWGTLAAHAQERLFFKDGHTQDGRITGVANGQVALAVTTASGAGEMAFDLGLIDHIDSPPPAAWQQGMAAFQARDWDKALGSLRPIVDQYRGLPTDWARQASLALGDIYLEKNQAPQAEAAYQAYRASYPGSDTLHLAVSQARLSMARQEEMKAKAQLEQIRDMGLQHPAEVTRADGAVYGQACFQLAQLEGRHGEFQAALQDDLRTVTLFYQDGALAARAQQNADAIRAAHPEVSVP